ncbi:MAG TPA: hypothetical protein VF681_14510 [Abditibacteriaceae bacterium]|jgi:hypothetical protein
MIHARKMHCRECRYPMMELKKFDGDSSYGVSDFNNKDATDYWLWGLWAIAHDLWLDLWKGGRLVARKKKVEKMRAEILPQFPHTMICPQCLHVERRTEPLPKTF